MFTVVHVIMKSIIINMIIMVISLGFPLCFPPPCKHLNWIVIPFMHTKWLSRCCIQEYDYDAYILSTILLTIKKVKLTL